MNKNDKFIQLANNNQVLYTFFIIIIYIKVNTQIKKYTTSKNKSKTNKKLLYLLE